MGADESFLSQIFGQSRITAEMQGIVIDCLKMGLKEDFKRANIPPDCSLNQ